MTEAPPEATRVTEVLVRNAFYQQHGIIRIAISDDTLQDLTTTATHPAHPDDVELMEMPGSAEWVDRMVRVRISTTRNSARLATEQQEQRAWFERLKEAILDVANEKKWCEEYDTFAEEWGLIPRHKDYDVFVTVRVRASSEEEAVEFVKNNVTGLTTYQSEDVKRDAEYSAEEA